MHALVQLATFVPSAHTIEDWLLYIPFLMGQLLYIVKRAGFSMRAGRVKSRWQYIYVNWDILLFRTVCELVLVYGPIRHYSPDQILQLFHLDLSNVTWLSFLSNPVSSPISLLAAGMASDGIFDWIVDWASRSPKIPEPIRNWLTENIPPMPLNGAH